MDELEDLLRQQDGVVSTSAAIRLIGRPALRWRLATGAWQRAAPRAVVTHSGPITDRQRLHIDVIRAGRGAVVAGITAARLDGLAGFDTRATHLLVPPTAQAVRRSGLVVHRDRQWQEDVHPALSPRRSRLPRAVVDAARWAGTDRLAAAVLLAAVQQRLVRACDLATELEVRPGRRRAGLIRSTLADAARGAGSTLEADLLALCGYLCLPEPTLQTRTADAARTVRWLDAAWPEFGVVVEIDGSAQLDVLAWWDDMRRQNALWISGRRILRFPAVALRLDRCVVAEQLVSALEAGGWQVDRRSRQRIVRLRS